MSTIHAADAPEELAWEGAAHLLAHALTNRWPDADPVALTTTAANLVQEIIEVGAAPWVLLSPDSVSDARRLAAAVLATSPQHDGSPPSISDLECARSVIATLAGPDVCAPYPGAAMSPDDLL